MKINPVYRTELPRIYELRDLLGDPMPAKAYFRNLDESLIDIPQKLRQLRQIEDNLQALDPAAWAFLKLEVKPLLTVRDDKRGWQALFDRLNQAKAYKYLKETGYETVTFIPSTPLRQTPDLEAISGTARALCEVKTINIFDIEARRRCSGGAIHIKGELDSTFFVKLASRLGDAEVQMAAYDPDPAVKRIIYAIINFDDLLHEYCGPLR